MGIRQFKRNAPTLYDGASWATQRNVEPFPNLLLPPSRKCSLHWWIGGTIVFVPVSVHPSAFPSLNGYRETEGKGPEVSFSYFLPLGKVTGLCQYQQRQQQPHDLSTVLMELREMTDEFLFRTNSVSLHCERGVENVDGLIFPRTSLY